MVARMDSQKKIVKEIVEDGYKRERGHDLYEA